MPFLNLPEFYKSHSVPLGRQRNLLIAKFALAIVDNMQHERSLPFIYSLDSLQAGQRMSAFTTYTDHLDKRDGFLQKAALLTQRVDEHAVKIGRPLLVVELDIDKGFLVRGPGTQQVEINNQTQFATDLIDTAEAILAV